MLHCNPPLFLLAHPYPLFYYFFGISFFMAYDYQTSSPHKKKWSSQRGGQRKKQSLPPHPTVMDITLRPSSRQRSNLCVQWKNP